MPERACSFEGVAQPVVDHPDDCGVRCADNGPGTDRHEELLSPGALGGRAGSCTLPGRWSPIHRAENSQEIL